MTIGEKSTELGIDLAQIALVKYGVGKCSKNGSFHCFTAKDGEQNIFIFNADDVPLHSGSFKWENDVLAEDASIIEVETAFKNFINTQEFTPIVIGTVEYEELT